MNSMRFCMLILFVILATRAQAQIHVSGVFGDHMVLQQGIPVPVWGWAKAGQKIDVKFNGQKQSVNTNHQGRWMVKLKPMKYGGPYQMEIGERNPVVFKDIYVGEVWVCSGQSNMDMTVAREDRYWCGVYNEHEEVASANYPLIRVFDVPFLPTDTAQQDVRSDWEVCSPKTVGHFSATAYFFAREIYTRYKIPVGLITTSFGASTAEAWTSREALMSHPQLSYLLDDYAARCAKYDTSMVSQKKYREAQETWLIESAKARENGKDRPREPKNPDPKKDQHSPAVLYNGMVAPLIPFAIKGALWYQGESNAPTAKIYHTQMEALIRNWRDHWQQGDFPFLYVQLANHQALVNEPVKDDPIVFIREEQLKNLSVTNTGMAVAIDNANPDDPNDIHPKNKQEIGKRLAILARAKAYGEQIAFSGPLYKSMKTDRSKIQIAFDHANGGLVAKDSILEGFAIAGRDGKFVWAEARIDGNTVIVSSDAVTEPVAVRYAWAKNPKGNLYNGAGLPASPFRTDID